MNVLDRITQLRLERNWSEYHLAEKSGLTQSTISTWYRKDMQPGIPSLNKICDAFDITMSQFFSEDSTLVIELTPDQRELIHCYSRLSGYQKKLLVDFLKTL